MCSRRAIDARMLARAGVDYVALPAVPPSSHPAGILRFLRGFRQSRQQCRDLIRDEGVNHVVALGGFVAVPAVAAARRAGTPVTLLNLDRPPGRACRWIAHRADRVWSAIDLPGHEGFAERVVGLPIRRCALAPAPPAECRRRLGLDPTCRTLLVTGASQGASAINDLVAHLLDRDPSIFARWQVVHLTGAGRARHVRAVYARHDVNARVDEFLDEIGLAWGAADLAVSRAGANSVAEAAANMVPALFLPYPHHRDQHQRHNAAPLVEIGGALVVDDAGRPETNAARVGPILRGLLAGDDARRAMREKLLEHRPRDAAALVASLLHTAPSPPARPEAAGAAAAGRG